MAVQFLLCLLIVFSGNFLPNSSAIKTSFKLLQLEGSITNYLGDRNILYLVLGGGYTV